MAATEDHVAQDAPAVEKKTAADLIVQHTDDLVAAYVWDGEHAYVVVQENGHVRNPGRALEGVQALGRLEAAGHG